MKCLISFERKEPDTIVGEKLVLKHTYTTFDKEEMDMLEKSFWDQYHSGIMAEFDIKKGKKNV